MRNNKIKHIFLLCFLIVAGIVESSAHNGFILHGEDIMAVLGLKKNTKLFNRSKDTKNNTSWVKFISTDMIDNTEFHKKLENNHYGFSISGPHRHRLLFHWAYDAEPWNKELEELIKDYCYAQDLNIENNIRIFKAEIKSEQIRRNREIIKKTKEVFGFGTGGVEEIYTHFFAAMAYNIHILGDYMSDNTVLGGLYDFEKLIGRIVVELRELDYAESKTIVKGITGITKQNIDIQKKADELMIYLKKSIPSFIKNARNGSLRRRVEAKYEFL